MSQPTVAPYSPSAHPGVAAACTVFGVAPMLRALIICDELGRHLACSAERRMVEHCEILLDGATRRFRRQTRGTFDAVTVAGVGLDQTGVDCKAFPTNQTLGNAALQYALEQTPQQVALTKPAVAIE